MAGDALPKPLERRRVVYDLGEHERKCPQCQGELKHIGEETSERLEYVPASLYVIEEACQKYACTKGCTVLTAQKPPCSRSRRVCRVRGCWRTWQSASMAIIFRCTVRKGSTSAKE